MVDWPRSPGALLAAALLVLVAAWVVLHVLQLLTVLVLGVLGALSVVMVLWFAVRYWWARR